MLISRNIETQTQREAALKDIAQRGGDKEYVNNVHADGNKSNNSLDSISEEVDGGYSVVDAVSENASKNGGTPTIQEKQDKSKSTTTSKRSSKKSKSMND